MAQLDPKLTPPGGQSLAPQSEHAHLHHGRIYLGKEQMSSNGHRPSTSLCYQLQAAPFTVLGLLRILCASDTLILPSLYEEGWDPGGRGEKMGLTWEKRFGSH